MIEKRNVTLSDGTPGYVRPIVPADGAALAEALKDLAPDSRMRRSLYDKTSLYDQRSVRLGAVVFEETGAALYHNFVA